MLFQEDEETSQVNSEADKRVSDNSEDPRTAVDESVKKLGVDHFNNEENDPKKSKAMSESLFPSIAYRNKFMVHPCMMKYIN